MNVMEPTKKERKQRLLKIALIVVVLQPGMGDVAAYGEDLLTGSPSNNGAARLFFPPAVSLSCLTLAVVLAVFKPWGRVRRAGSRQRPGLGDEGDVRRPS